jgi:hypothetical protein
MTREICVELLLGRRVHDVEGRVAGRIEEFIVVLDGGHSVVTEFHLGSAAVLERLLGATASLPFFGWVASARAKKVQWNQIDISDPRNPRLRVRREELVSK